jgi:hypothetical protein
MSTVTRPRGPLPPRVYWTRRLLVAALALALVFGISHLLGGSPGKSDNPSARPAAASAGSATAGDHRTPGPTTNPTTGSTNASTTANGDGPKSKKDKAGKVKVPLAVPTGPCADSDVVVVPSVDGDAFAGHDVTITLNLRTVESPACTWQVSPESVVVKLSSGSDRIWSTQDCPAAVTEQSVVVRKDHVTKAEVTWSGQRSDDECTRTTDWAQPGFYHAEAAALGSEPEDRQFELMEPVAPTITATPKVDPKKARDKGKKPTER